MAEKENSAFRLYRFIQRMVGQPENNSTAQVLMNAFGIDKDSSVRQQNAMLSRVTVLLFTELESLVAELKRHEYSDEAIDPMTAPFDKLTAVGLASPWQQHKGGFAASLLVLRLIGESPDLLTEDGTVISKDDLAELSKDIETLRQEVQTSNLPESVKDFICHQLDIIAAGRSGGVQSRGEGCNLSRSRTFRNCCGVQQNSADDQLESNSGEGC